MIVKDVVHNFINTYEIDTIDLIRPNLKRPITYEKLVIGALLNTYSTFKVVGLIYHFKLKKLTLCIE